LPINLHFEIRDGDIAVLTEAVGFPEQFARGWGDVRGGLTGSVHRGDPLLSHLAGRIEVTTGPGEEHRSLPIVTAVANLTEGLENDDVVRFSSIETTLDLDGGVISTDRFALDGPMRIIAEGRFDPQASEDSLDITVGVFIMRQLDQALKGVPIIEYLTDSDKGLFGVYFDLDGTWAEPKVKALPIKSLAQGNILSQVVQAPLRMLRDFGAVLRKSAEAPPASD
jgi:hypothetical protein